MTHLEVTQSQIEEEVTVCPYCMNDWSEKKDIYGCCGEVHSEVAYVIDGAVYLENEIEIVEDAS